MTIQDAVVPLLDDIRKCAHFVHKRCSHWTEDDLFSEGVLAAIHAIPKYKPDRSASWKTFCLFKAEMGMLDAIRFSLRSKKRRARHALPLPESGLAARRALPPFYQLQVSDLVQLALSVLTPKQNRAFRLYFLEGFSMRETGSLMGTSESAVSSLVAAGMERARAFMLSRQWECPV